MHTVSRIRRVALTCVAALPLAACALHAAAAATPEEFFKAIEFDDDRGLQRMMAGGLDANLRNAKGEPALFVAVRDNSIKAVTLLSQTPGIEIDARNQVGETALMIASLKGEDDAVGVLLAHGAATRKDGYTPLHYAASGGDAATVAQLLSHGAVLEARSPNGSTPLMMACRYGSEEVVKALLAAGADRTLKNDLGMNAAAFAASAGRDSLAKRLNEGWSGG